MIIINNEDSMFKAGDTFTVVKKGLGEVRLPETKEAAQPEHDVITDLDEEMKFEIGDKVCHYSLGVLTIGQIAQAPGGVVYISREFYSFTNHDIKVIEPYEYEIGDKVVINTDDTS